MGLYRTHYVIVGIKVSQEEFDDYPPLPLESDLPGDIIAIDGGAADIGGDIVLGRVIQSIDKYDTVPEVKDLSALWEHNFTVANDLEEMGYHLQSNPDLPDRPRLYSVVSVR